MKLREGHEEPGSRRDRPSGGRLYAPPRQMQGKEPVLTDGRTSCKQAPIDVRMANVVAVLLCLPALTTNHGKAAAGSLSSRSGSSSAKRRRPPGDREPPVAALCAHITCAPLR